MKGVLPPNSPSFQKFWYQERIKKKKNNTENKFKNHPTTGNAAPCAVRIQEMNRPCPLKWSHSERALCALLLSAVQQLAPRQNRHNSTQTGTAGLCHERRPDEVSSWAPDDNFWSLGRVDLSLPTSHHKLLSSGDLHPFNTAFQANLAKTASQLWKFLGRCT